MIDGQNRPAELDVRVIPPREKHPTIFRTFEELPVGTSFDLVNDHDPFPLRYQFEAQRPGEFEWTYVEEGPEVWRVRIGRVAGSAGNAQMPRGGCATSAPRGLPIHEASPGKG